MLWRYDKNKTPVSCNTGRLFGHVQPVKLQCRLNILSKACVLKVYLLFENFENY